SVLVSSSSLTVQLIKIQSLTNQISNDQLIKENINENDFSKKHLIYLKHELLLSRLENLMRQGIYNDDFIDRYNLISNDVESEKLFENQTVAKVEEINKLTKAHKDRYELIVKYKNQKMNDNIVLITLPRLPTNRRILH
ncbi:MAG: hypothetical protein KDK40_04005, partial [Chlamydiia bacterium]|nr:hypothetical protein [Chlamydiia bacterium]